MSAGEQQRVAVARALAKRPRLILADEPTASLDHENAEAIMTLLMEMCEEYRCTLVLVTHAREVIRRFSHTVKLETLNQASRSA
jgi:ABC-type lipoprotein export system ATPase subunit